MLTDREIISTLEMLENGNLDVRTVTLGINLLDCAGASLNRVKDKIFTKIAHLAQNLAVKKGGAFTSSRVGGLSGAFIPVSEDLNISEAARRGYIGLDKLEAITSVCSVGLDMVAVSGDTTEDCISAIIADETAIGVINNKTTATRLIPVPGKWAGENAFFGGLLGQSTIVPVNNGSGKNQFISHGGLIPAPIQSLTN